jgi:hypothetical protein
VPQPRAEEADHPLISVGEVHCTIDLRALAGVERDAGGQERGVAQRADALETL